MLSSCYFLGWVGGLFHWGVDIVEVMSSLYIGFATTFLGGIIGALWGFVDGVICGILVAVFYNMGCTMCCTKKKVAKGKK